MSSYVRKSAFVIHSQAKPELVRITRNFRRNGLTIVTLWHSGVTAWFVLASAAYQDSTSHKGPRLEVLAEERIA